MKIYILQPNENWIVDRMANEFKSFNLNFISNNINDANVIWLLADWCWEQIPISLLKSKKVVTTIHHITPSKFSKAEQINFSRRDEITDVYHVFNARTQEFIRKFTNKPIVLIPYWIDLNFWRRPDHQDEANSYREAREKLKLSKDLFLISSFQRDTEGTGIASGNYIPKLEKGPDIFCDAVQKLYQSYYNEDCTKLEVLLGGWRRQYVMQRLEAFNIKYHYIERPPIEIIKDMYIASDLYIVGSRWEGGPQAILEAAAMGTPIISTPVGIAEQILHPDSINEDLTLAKIGKQYVDYAYKNIIEKFDSKRVLPEYMQFFNDL